MVAKTPRKIIRTDKWQLNPTQAQKILLGETVKVYRRFCRFLTGVVFTHWDKLGSLSTKEVVPAVERLIHSTSKNPNIKYAQFGLAFYKFPSYYRRVAIVFAVGQVSSFYSRYLEWQSGIRKRRDAKPPKLNPDAQCYPSLYKGQCYKLQGQEQVEIKVFTGKDWVWTTVQIVGVRERHKVDSNKLLSPQLIFNNNKCHLSVPFECHPEKRQPSQNVVAVDLGINSAATVSVVNFDGTVIHREFIHPGRDIDRRDKRLKSISAKASSTMGKGGKLHKGFCSNTYRKCQNINQQIAHIVSKKIVDIAIQFNTEAIVFERLKGWKPKGGRKRSTLKQRFHGWLKSKIRDFTEMKWRELGGRVIEIIAAYTSKLAYDGSGYVRRNSENYALARFTSGKQYNCDLNGSYNIAARGIIKLTRRNDREDRSSKSSGRSPRSWACLCDLWVSPNSKLA
jgi:IS605 OrfB family transposase